MGVKSVHMTLPTKQGLYGGAVGNFPAGMAPSDHAIKVLAYKAYKAEIDSGIFMDVHIANTGVVHFRFTPSEDYPECGASRATFTKSVK